MDDLSLLRARMREERDAERSRAAVIAYLAVAFLIVGGALLVWAVIRSGIYSAW